MSSHELAHQLLDGPDLPVETVVQGTFGENGDWDAVWGQPHLVKTKDGSVQIYATVRDDSEDDD